MTIITILGLFTSQVKAIKVEQNIEYPLDTFQLIVENQRIKTHPPYNEDREYRLKFWNHQLIFDSTQRSISIIEPERP